MSLVTYSDSEASESEVPLPPRPAPKDASNAGKSTFKKVVDHSNPYKIRVNLPEPTKATTTDGDEVEDGPRVKRAKTGESSAFSGFNALLPAPKRGGAPKTSTNGGEAKTSGLGAGVSLKTGAAPGFSRERVEDQVDKDNPDKEVLSKSNAFEEINGPNPTETMATDDVGLPKPISGDSLPNKTAMFRPLSVARKPGFKKTSKSIRIEGGLSSSSISEAKQVAALPKKSLFSSGENPENPAAQGLPLSEPGAHYQPLIYEADADPEQAHTPINDLSPNVLPPEDVPLADPNSLDSIASTLKLSKSERRQLFGRHKNQDPGSSSAISITNLNMDSEYAANELLRQAGEQAQHNPVRSINAAGKNSLKSLVSTASTQRDALEEQFASGRRNKGEAGRRYGW